MSNTGDVTIPWNVAVLLLRPRMVCALLGTANADGEPHTARTAKAYIDKLVRTNDPAFQPLMEETLRSIQVPVEVTMANKCGFYGCWELKLPAGHCHRHNSLSYYTDMKLFRDLITDGYSRTEAALRAGLIDPPE